MISPTANNRNVHRRTWFLERVLKLGLTQIAKEYECVRRLRNLFLFVSFLSAGGKGPFRDVNLNMDPNL